MTYRIHLTAAALALGLVAAASAASAQPYGKGGNYSMAQPPAAQPRPARDCDCPMMKGDQAMREQCMTMMRDHAPPAPKNGPAR
ncbi:MULTISPECIES: hypothetical protein [Caulobacteraceae]|jgi:hypothetical protein|uniref:hypothetical protein n=1 Tax=Caulobacteraceae TaxID=76892 RepID=UPI00083320B2|nr:MULTISPECIES: hypothetical protein [Caulobacteraceae]MDP1875557.1 hypothetical protein [Phenylobacterium sp.]OYW91503.1 MAG: hypothetical protein B7Z13_12395 [Caulobacterales bacterium 32-67-6]